MEGQYKPEQFTLPERNDVVVPVREGRFVLQADQEKFKRQVLAPFPEDVQAAYMNTWHFNSLSFEPMRAFLARRHANAPLQQRLQLQLANLFTPSIGIQSGPYINIDAAGIINNLAGLHERYTDEEKMMVVKQTLDATLRHEAQHMRQLIRGDLMHDTKAYDTYYKQRAMAKGGYVAGMAGAGVSLMLMATQRVAETYTTEQLSQKLAHSSAVHEVLQSLAHVSSSQPFSTAVDVLTVGSAAAVLGSVRLFCVNRKQYANIPAERDAEEQEKPEYFSEQSPLTVSFELEAQPGTAGSK
jgi:hypothetical protein